MREASQTFSGASPAGRREIGTRQAQVAAVEKDIDAAVEEEGKEEGKEEGRGKKRPRREDQDDAVIEAD